MEFEETIEKRRSIRKFKARKVEKEKVEKMLECARRCQSAKNRQPWRFLILEGKEKDRVANIMLRFFEQNDIALPGYLNSSKNSAHIIKNAPLLILVFKETDENWNTGDLLSIGAAIEHICLEAVNLKLGTVWIRDTVYTQDEICKAFEQEDLALVSAVAVGYPDEDPAPRPRKSRNEIVLQYAK